MSPGPPADSSLADFLKLLEQVSAEAARESAEAEAEARTAESGGAESAARSEETFFKLSEADEAEITAKKHELRIRELELTEREIQTDRLRTSLDQFKKEIEDRTQYARRLFKLSATWLALILATVWASAFSCRVAFYRLWVLSIPYPSWMRFELSDTVLVTLITTTTATVIGLFAIVLHYLFPKSEKPGG